MIFKYSQSVLIALITDYGVLHVDKGYNHLSKHNERHHMKIWLSSFNLHRHWILNRPGTRIPNSSLAGSLTRVLARPQGKQRSNDYACVNVWVAHRPMLSYRNYTQPRKPKNQVILKLFKFGPIFFTFVSFL